MMRSSGIQAVSVGDEETASLLHKAPRQVAKKEHRWICWLSSLSAVGILLFATTGRREGNLYNNSASLSNEESSRDRTLLDSRIALWEEWKQSLLPESLVLPLEQSDYRNRRNDDDWAPRLKQAKENLQDDAQHAKEWLSHKTSDGEDWWSHEEENASGWWQDESEEVKRFFREQALPKSREALNATEAWTSKEEKRAQTWWANESEETRQWFRKHANSTKHWVADEANTTEHWIANEANATGHWVTDEANNTERWVGQEATTTRHWVKHEGKQVRNWWESEETNTKTFFRKHMNETEAWVGEESAQTGQWFGSEEEKAQNWWNGASEKVRQGFRTRANATKDWAANEEEQAREWVGKEDDRAKHWIEGESNATEQWFSDESTAARHFFRGERRAMKHWWATVTAGIHNRTHFLLHGTPELIYLNDTDAYSLISNGLPHDYFALQRGLDAQINQAYCAVAASVAILNSFHDVLALPTDPLYKPYEYATQSDVFNDCTIATVVAQNHSFDGILAAPGGLGMDQAKALLECHLPRDSWNVEAVHMDPSNMTVDAMRESLLASLRSPKERVMINYDRSAIGQMGHGHWSPLGSYSRRRDAFLILDVAKYKYPAVWVPTTWLHGAVSTLDTCGTLHFPQAQDTLPERLLHPNTTKDFRKALKSLGCKATYRGYIVVTKL